VTEYTVQAGDTLVRIAERFGFADWREIYHAPENAAFRKARPNPDRIFPGDQLIIPSRTPAGFRAGQRHRFRLTRAIAPPVWTAAWDRPDEPATYDCERAMILTAPDLPAGQAVTFTVTQIGYGAIGTITANSDAGRASAPWSDWFARARVSARVHLAAGEPFPVVAFTFVAEAAGAQAASAPLRYADQLEARLEAPDVRAPAQPADYLLLSPYGTRKGTTDADGVLREPDLPPGGTSVVFVQHVLEPT